MRETIDQEVSIVHSAIIAWAESICQSVDTRSPKCPARIGKLRRRTVAAVSFVRRREGSEVLEALLAVIMRQQGVAGARRFVDIIAMWMQDLVEEAPFVDEAGPYWQERRSAAQPGELG